MNKTLIVMGLMSSGLCWAAEDAADGWSGTGQLGFTLTGGNTDTETLSAGLHLKKETDPWIYEVGLNLLRASTNDVDTAERFDVSGKVGWKLDDNDYVFGAVRYDNDNFSGFDYSVTTGFGWGHIFADDEDGRLITELGLAHKTQAIDVDTSEVSDAVLTGKLDYMRPLTDTVKFIDLLVIEAGSDNTFAQNDAGVAFKVNDAFSVKLTHQVRHNTDVPVGFKKTDTLFSASLAYDF